MRFDAEGNEIKEMALAHFEEDSIIEVTCIPKKQLHFKKDTGFGIYLCDICLIGVETKPDDFKLNGSFIKELDMGHTYQVTGTVSSYQGKKQLKLSSQGIKKVQPINGYGVLALLKQLPGLGHLAEVVYATYGLASIQKILYHPEEVLKVCPVFYPELIHSWRKFLAEIKDDQGLMQDLMALGLKAYQAKALYETYKEQTLVFIQRNPYFLSKEVSGYSFLKCDKLARQMGFDLRSPLRIHEAMMTVLETSRQEGHTYLPIEVFTERCIDFLNIRLTVIEMKQLYKTGDVKPCYTIGPKAFHLTRQAIGDSLKAYQAAYTQIEKLRARLCVVAFTKDDVLKEMKVMQMEKRLVIDGDHVYTWRMYQNEEEVAYHLSQLARQEKPFDSPIDSALDHYLQTQGITLEQRQREAVLAGASSEGGFLVIDGSAGCGKTFCLKIALELIQKRYLEKKGYFEVLVLAPTGKAARVAAKATGLPTATVHRALGGNPVDGFFHNMKRPLPYDCIVLDESSMLDIELAKSLLAAIAPRTKVIFLGDTKQLASVGPGNVLRDIIASKCVKVVTLNVVKRQGKDSGNLINANHIVQKEMIETQSQTGDALVLELCDDETVRKNTLLLADQLRKRFRKEEIQVLCPQKEGAAGTHNMNVLSQNLYNPNEDPLQIYNKTVTFQSDGVNSKKDLYFKTGDKVMQIRNNYNLTWYTLKEGRLILSKEGKGVTNGECGVILKLFHAKDSEKSETLHMLVRFDEKLVLYKYDFSELDHAYAMTIHKSQGSEWGAIILPLTGGSNRMTDNNLLYTGYTRTKTFGAVIATQGVILPAIKREKSIIRYTGLQKRLKAYFNQ